METAGGEPQNLTEGAMDGSGYLGAELVSRRAPHSHAALDCEALTDASYATLTGEDWSAEEASGDLVVDVELPGDMSSDWRIPVAAVVLGHDAVRVGAPLPVRRVPDADGPFNKTLIAILAGERWRVCADLQSNGSVLPMDGYASTRRTPAFGPERRLASYCVPG